MKPYRSIKQIDNPKKLTILKLFGKKKHLITHKFNRMDSRIWLKSKNFPIYMIRSTLNYQIVSIFLNKRYSILFYKNSLIVIFNLKIASKWNYHHDYAEKFISNNKFENCTEKIQCPQKNDKNAA
jgi:hypothetical protein